MSMLEKKKRRLDPWWASMLKQEAGGREATADSVIDVLLGDKEGYNTSYYVVYHYDELGSSTFMNRLNRLWVYPLFIVIAPFQYLFTGNVGFNRNSFMGRIVDKLIDFKSI